MVVDASTRTVPIKLDVDESAAELLRQTTDYFLDAANHVVNVAWEPDWKITSKQKLRDLTYYNIRDDSQLPDGNSVGARGCPASRSQANRAFRAIASHSLERDYR
jgi:hypothetical protein